MKADARLLNFDIILHWQHCGGAGPAISPEEEHPTNERKIPGLATIFWTCVWCGYGARCGKFLGHLRVREHEEGRASNYIHNPKHFITVDYFVPLTCGRTPCWHISCRIWNADLIWAMRARPTHGHLQNLLFFITDSRYFHYAAIRIIGKPDWYQEKLPTSATCFYTLCMPFYENEALMARKLSMATMNYEGYGFIWFTPFCWFVIRHFTCRAISVTMLSCKLRSLNTTNRVSSLGGVSVLLE